jgi:hypothetical protein
MSRDAEMSHARERGINRSAIRNIYVRLRLRENEWHTIDLEPGIRMASLLSFLS